MPERQKPYLTLRINDEEREAFEEGARVAGMTLHGWCRDVLRSARALPQKNIGNLGGQWRAYRPKNGSRS